MSRAGRIIGMNEGEEREILLNLESLIDRLDQTHAVYLRFPNSVSEKYRDEAQDIEIMLNKLGEVVSGLMEVQNRMRAISSLVDLGGEDA